MVQSNGHIGVCIYSILISNFSFLINVTVCSQVENFEQESRRKPCIALWIPLDNFLTIRTIIKLDYYAATGLSSFLNPANASDHGNLSIVQSLRYSWQVERPGRVALTNTFTHRLGVLWIFDSLFTVSADENSFRSLAEVSLPVPLRLAAESELSTALFRHTFMTPLVWNLSAGLTCPVKGWGTVLLGITGARLTVIRNAAIYAEKQVSTYCGVPEGKHSRFEYGLSLRIQAERRLGKALSWNCDLLLFKGFTQPIDLNLKNLFEWRISRLLLLSLQTRVFYDSEVSARLRIENLVSAGFGVKL